MSTQSGFHEPQPAAGRLKSGPAPELIRSANRRELMAAPFLFRGLSLADLSHVIMLMETAIIPRPAAKELLGALLVAHAVPLEEFPLDPALGDVYKNREAYINQIAPGAGGWLRVGRARREATNIAYRLAVRQRLLALHNAIIDLSQTIVDRAQEHIATLMPDYTYLQQAQPTTLGHYLLGFVYPMLRDAERLRSCLRLINRNPGGIGSVNGSRLPLNRQRVAELLGFDAVIHHTRDAMWQPDTPIEVSMTAVALLVNLDRLAEDLQVWVTQEFSLVELDDAYTRTSVIMPQKKNPYSLAYVRGLANVATGTLMAMVSVGRTPSGQPDNRIFAYKDVPELLDQATDAAALVTGVMRTLVVNTKIMAQRAGLGYSQATDLADAIMLATGLPYQSTHRIVGSVVATALARGISAGQITVEMVDEAAQRVVGHPLNLSAEMVAAALDPRAIVETRTGTGGAAHDPMQVMLAECRKTVAGERQWQIEVDRRLTAAETRLVKLAGQIVGCPEGGASS